jgi:hypothetical protein
MPRTGNLKLTLRESSGAVSGILDIDGPYGNIDAIGYLVPYSFDVKGSVTPSGELHLEGFRDLGLQRGFETCGPTSVNLTEWNSTRTGGLLQGRIALSTSGFHGFCMFPQTIRLSSDLAEVHLLK